jgi:hypothetical protein
MSLLRLFPLALALVAGGCEFQHSKADVERGRLALAAALDSWKTREPADRLKARTDPIEFNDDLRRTHALADYTLGTPTRTDPEVLRYPATLKLEALKGKAKGKAEDRSVVFMVALKSPIAISIDPYE